ncbi:uncharacterized protein J8A68_004692 [[Candida] subhashii]|uniref:Uncharacterized protein n=1 Tax=[Candida] subhashii TaxID=561895 RepID=A0A8J5UF78_9ASCO|nr:uncharacterized protein J8A68_004692 [[Candida] subhashii]KAG7661803.1 hypothetical protein J8A68_004692 [[Candida] subhashii]
MPWGSNNNQEQPPHPTFHHKEGRSTIKITPPPPTPPRTDPNGPARTIDSPFIHHLKQTGRAEWKLADPKLKQRSNAIFLILLSIPVLAISSYELFNRFQGRSHKKLQKGEILEGQLVRDFTEEEIVQREQSSILTKLFGQDPFVEKVSPKSSSTTTSTTEK